VLGGLGFAIRMNNLKASASRMAPEIVTGPRCLRYQRLSVRLAILWDGTFATRMRALMISNDRVLSANAAMLLVHKDD
jgi:hypothetical protein